MPTPLSVNTSKFTVESILFDHNDFSICSGFWNPTGNRVLGMRWNDGDDGNGYPKAFGHPQWFVISDDVAKNILSGLITNPLLSPTEYNSIIDTLKKF